MNNCIVSDCKGETHFNLCMDCFKDFLKSKRPTPEAYARNVSK